MIQDILKAVLPIVVACLAWLLGQVSDFSTRLTKIEGQMPALITKENVPVNIGGVVIGNPDMSPSIPESSSALLGGLGMLILFRRRR